MVPISSMHRIPTMSDNGGKFPRLSYAIQSDFDITYAKIHVTSVAVSVRVEVSVSFERCIDN